MEKIVHGTSNQDSSRKSQAPTATTTLINGTDGAYIGCGQSAFAYFRGIVCLAADLIPKRIFLLVFAMLVGIDDSH